MEDLELLDELQRKLYAYESAMSALYLDGATVAPKDTADGRGVAMGILAGEEHQRMTAPETGALLDRLSEAALDFPRQRQVEELRRNRKLLMQIPVKEYQEYQELTNKAFNVWQLAKKRSDFLLFQPYLEKLLAYKRKFAGYYDSTKAPYDAMLDDYERGMNMAFLDNFFAILREKLSPVLQSVIEKPQPDISFLHRHYPIAIQREFSDYLMEVLGLDRTHCAIGETEHPFTLNFNNKDVRITTHYHADDVARSMYSVIHEGGHAKYELGVRDDLQYTVLAGGSSMSIHESQSRFYENIIGRSEPFIGAIFPKMQEFFPEQLSDVTAEMFYRAVNEARPSLIRTEADELTYCFHIMIRYELEKHLVGGDITVADIPAEWNRLYKDYLGLDVPDDRRGCLQDSHWAGGSFGYFPSYALGGAYGAQILQNMEKDIDVWGPVSHGDLSGVSAWLKEKIHQYGKLWKPADLVKNACGTLDPSVYTDYLTRKFCRLYDLHL